MFMTYVIIYQLNMVISHTATTTCHNNQLVYQSATDLRHEAADAPLDAQERSTSLGTRRICLWFPCWLRYVEMEETQLPQITSTNI